MGIVVVLAFGGVFPVWRVARGEAAKTLLQAAYAFHEQGDDIGATIRIERAKKKTKDPLLLGKIEALYRAEERVS
ncbi:MAG: hypothetical protein KAI47_04715 [Deltaproteobacteria bacterium]|nr:hypothetical protein [Deltaproteobacteria bacterium]